MPFSAVFSALVQKAERKGKPKADVLALASWQTGYTPEQIEALEDTNLSYGAFFVQAPSPNPQRLFVSGKVCGVQIEQIADPVMREVRILDRLVEQLVKGKTTKQILETYETTTTLPPHTIEEYIARQPEEHRPLLHSIHSTLCKTLPHATPKIAWQMPTYYQGANLLHFALAKFHVGIYPGPDAITHFAPQLAQYQTSRGAVQIPLYEEFPFDLLIEMAKWCEAHNAK